MTPAFAARRTAFVDLVQQVSRVMTGPTFHGFLVVVTGWAFVRQRLVTNMIMDAMPLDVVSFGTENRFRSRFGDTP